MKTIIATQVFDLRTITQRWNILSVSVGPTGDPVVLTAQEAPDRVSVAWGRGQFFSGRVRQPLHFRVYHRNGPDSPQQVVEIVDLPESLEAFGIVQPLSGGRWLLTDPKPLQSGSPNAFVYAPGARLPTSFVAGDGIIDVQVSDQDSVWIAFSDEATVGGSGLGLEGLVCLSSAGELLVRYNHLAGGLRLPPIVDCSALNVGPADQVWVCYYQDFPLVRLKGLEIDRAWTEFPVVFAGGLAADGDRVLLARPFNGGLLSDELFLVTLSDMTVEEFCAVGPEGTRIEFFRSYGRGSCLYLESRDALYSIELRDI